MLNLKCDNYLIMTLTQLTEGKVLLLLLLPINFKNPAQS